MIRHVLAASVWALGDLYLSGVPSASAETPFPFKAYPAELDFSQPDAVMRFESMIEEIGGQSFVYLDWHLKNGWMSEVFNMLDNAITDAADPDADLESEMCGKLADALLSSGGRVEFRGRPNPDNNHLLLTITFRLSDEDPFAIARCEFSGAPSFSPRLRGFFYVTEDRIATANQYELRPVTVDAARIPADFFRAQQQ